MYEIHLYSTIAHTLTSLKMFYDTTVKEVIELYRTTFHNICYIFITFRYRLSCLLFKRDTNQA